MSALNISSFIWGIADDVLRDVYVRGKYRDVILPMTVIRRLDAVLEPTKEAVRAHEEASGRRRYHQPGRRPAPGLRRGVSTTRRRFGSAICITRTNRQQQRLRADFEAYLDGFSPNIQEVLDKFKFRNQIPTLVDTPTRSASCWRSSWTAPSTSARARS